MLSMPVFKKIIGESTSVHQLEFAWRESTCLDIIISCHEHPSFLQTLMEEILDSSCHFQNNKTLMVSKAWTWI